MHENLVMSCSSTERPRECQAHESGEAMSAEGAPGEALACTLLSPRESGALSAGEPLRIVWTTPNGLTGAGGMDRLSQLVTAAVNGDSLRRVTVIPLTTKGKWGKAVGAFVFAFALARFTLIAAARRVDVLHINVAAYGSVYRKIILAGLARAFAIPYIVHVHTGRFGEFWQGASPRLAASVDRFFAHSVAIIVLGRDFARMVKERLPRLADKVHLVRNATPSRRSVPRDPSPQDRIQLTTIGLLGPNKHTTQLIEALARLKGRSDWVATIAGNGEVEAARDRVKSLGLSDRISVPGWIAQPAVQELLGRTDIFVLPSRSEGMPMAILEALSYGIAIVATPVGAIPEVVTHERNGLFVPVGDEDQLVSALTRLLDDGDLRRSLGAQGLKDHAAKFTLHAYLQRIEGIWRSAARGKAHDTPSP